MYSVVCKMGDQYRPCGIRFSESSSCICLFETVGQALEWTKLNPEIDWYCISQAEISWTKNGVVLEKSWLEPVTLNPLSQTAMMTEA